MSAKNTAETKVAKKKGKKEKNWSKPGFFTVGLKLNLTVSLILVIFLAGVTFIATYFFQDDSIRRIQEMVSDKSRVLSLKLSKDLDGIQEKSHLIAFALQHEGDVSNAYQRQLLSNEKNIFYVAVVKKTTGGLRVEEQISNDKLIERDFPVLPNFKTTLQKEKSFAKTVFSPTMSVNNVSIYFDFPTIMASFPLASNIAEKKVPTTSVVVFFSMNVFLEGLQTHSEYLTYIVNDQGDIVGHPDSNLLINNVNFSKNEIVRSMLTGSLNNRQMTYLDEKGKEQIGSFSKIRTGNLAVISTVDKDTALEAVYQLRWRNMLITFSALIISVMIIYLLAKSLTSPVKTLVSASEKVSKGDYNLQLKPKSRDEIGVLTKSFVSMAGGLAERERMKKTFGKFVNEQIADMAMKGEIKLGGERKQVAVFFSDIRSFTAISESMQPEQVVEFLNEYMTAMVDCVNATNGVVDKYIGDAIMAVWGTPVSYGNDTENAVNGALMMRTALMKFNANRGGEGKPIIRIGCGINTGPVLAGQIGSSSRMEYTVIGDAVNLASRVEALNKPFGTDVLITSDAYALVKNIFAVEAMKKIKVKGKTEPQQIYAVLGRKDDPNCPKSMNEVRDIVGIPHVDLSKVDADKEEVKYEISEK